MQRLTRTRMETYEAASLTRWSPARLCGNKFEELWEHDATEFTSFVELLGRRTEPAGRCARQGLLGQQPIRVWTRLQLVSDSYCGNGQKDSQ